MICYELWGYDTYSREAYLCGVYKHYSSAKRAMKRLQQDCLETQSEGLRDTFGIKKSTAEEHDDEGRQPCYTEDEKKGEGNYFTNVNLPFLAESKLFTEANILFQSYLIACHLLYASEIFVPVFFSRVMYI